MLRWHDFYNDIYLCTMQTYRGLGSLLALGFDFWPCALHLITIDLLTNKFFMCFLSHGVQNLSQPTEYCVSNCLLGTFLIEEMSDK